MPRTTMTIAEAEHVLDLLSAALQDPRHPPGQHPVSSLGGHDLFDVVNALKLRIANEYLQLSHRSDFEQQFAEGLKLYDGIPWQVMSSFVADEHLGRTGAPLAMSAVDPATMRLDKRFEHIETASSFGDFCKTLGSTEPRYWERVYQRIGLKHTSASPRGNEPVLCPAANQAEPVAPAMVAGTPSLKILVIALLAFSAYRFCLIGWAALPGNLRLFAIAAIGLGFTALIFGPLRTFGVRSRKMGLLLLVIAVVAFLFLNAL